MFDKLNLLEIIVFAFLIGTTIGTMYNIRNSLQSLLSIEDILIETNCQQTEYSFCEKQETEE